MAEPDDAFEHLDEELWAQEAIKKFGVVLVSEAARIMAKRGDAELAGLILERGSAEWEAFRSMIEQDAGKEITASVFTGIVPRDLARDLLASSAGEAGTRWLDEDAPVFLGKLPVVAVSRNGVQCAALDIPEAP